MKKLNLSVLLIPFLFSSQALAQEVGSWLEGIQTRYVSEVYFDDVSFARYLPTKNPYQTVTKQLEALPVEHLNAAVSSYGTGLPDGVSPFHSRRKNGGVPTSGLFQRAEYLFKATCVGCVESVSFNHDGISFSEVDPSKSNRRYVTIAYQNVTAEHFEKYPFLLEVFELQAMMLDHTNPKSYVYRRAQALHHGFQAVINFVEQKKIKLSEYAAQQMEKMSKLSVNTRILSRLMDDIQTEKAILEPSMRYGSNGNPDRYPYQSIAGKHVLLRAILDSIYGTGDIRAKALLVVENYRKRNAAAAYRMAEFSNSNSWVPRNLGPRPEGARPYAWWDESSHWFSSKPLRMPVRTCEGLFFPTN